MNIIKEYYDLEEGTPFYFEIKKLNNNNKIVKKFMLFNIIENFGSKNFLKLITKYKNETLESFISRVTGEQIIFRGYKCQILT